MVTLPSDYEREALRAIYEWKNAEPGGLERALGLASWPADRAAAAASMLPGFDRVLERTVGALTEELGGAALWSVRPGAIFREYRAAGCPVESRDDIFDLCLGDVDRVIGYLPAKYAALAGGEGMASGFLGALGIPADIIALVALAVRAMGEYATYCGFDVARPEERAFALEVLEMVSSPSQKTKRAALNRLVKRGRNLAARHAAKGAGAGAFGLATKQFAQSLGEKLARAKASQFLPVAGAAIGAGQNALFMRDLCKASNCLCRERFLAAKYGPEWIAIAAAENGEGSAEESRET